MRPMILLLVATACQRAPTDPPVTPSGPDSATDSVAVDSDPVDTPADTVDSDAGLPAGLNGVAPAQPLHLPDFVATNSDGGLRGPDDLRGHPTVVWFFPAANTPG